MADKSDHIQTIKTRLYRLADGISLNKLKSMLEAVAGYEFHYDTLRNTMNPSSNALDVAVVAAMAKCFEVDVAQLLAPAGAPVEVEKGSFDESKTEVLTDIKYCGKTYGYLYSSKLTRTDIDTFCLDIKSVGDTVKAFFKLEYHTTEKGQEIISRKEYIGTPYIVNGKNIIAVLRDGTGDFVFLSFSYVHYSVSQIYFRRGIVATRLREAHRSPLMQCFVMFDAPLAPEAHKYIPGFLSLTDQYDLLHIPVGALNQLSEDDEDVKQFCSKCYYLFREENKEYYTVTEQQLIANSRGVMPLNQSMRAILLIKGIAQVPTRVTFPEHDDLSDFTRSLPKQWDLL